MYKYAATDSIFDGISNIYLISIATAFLAVVIVFYCSNFLKDESEKQLEKVLNEVCDEQGEEGLAEQDDCLNDTETENHYQLKQKRLALYELENTSDYEDNDIYKNVYAKRNSTSTNDNSDIDYDTDDMNLYGLISKLKSKKHKELEAQLTRDELEQEKRIEREQLAAIFELLKKQEAELNMKEFKESELTAQLALYPLQIN